MTGATGMLGRAVVAALGDAGFEPRTHTHADGDLAEGGAADDLVRAPGVRVVINCAAFTDVEGCEDPANAGAVRAGNVLIPEHLARACHENGRRLVHISTDYVFDGEKAEPYIEDDAANPRSAYGRSKLAGEKAVRRELPDGHLIVRTAWLYGAGGRNFVDTIRRLTDEREELRVVNDQRGSPTWVRDLAAAILACVASHARGTVHATNAGATTWFGLASRILELEPHAARLTPCTTAEYPQKARRPANSVLSCDRLVGLTGYRPRAWDAALADYLASSS
ncbi:dTDP-4-dehydrorhamnose reductase [bacterium]|nr:dTDP-4-dehydrorhamnose reductase [bacterium]